MTGALPHVPDFHHFSMAFRSYVHIPGRRRKHQTLSRVAEHCVTSADRESLVELPVNVAGDDDRSGGQPITGEHVPIFYANRSEHESRECTMIISQTLCVRIGTAYRTLPRLQREESKARRIEERQAPQSHRWCLFSGPQSHSTARSAVRAGGASRAETVENPVAPRARNKINTATRRARDPLRRPREARPCFKDHASFGEARLRERRREPCERSEPAKRLARERVGESERRKPLGVIARGAAPVGRRRHAS